MKPIIHIDGVDDDMLSEADKVKTAIAFLNTAPSNNDDDCYAYGIARFVLDAWLGTGDKEIFDQDEQSAILIAAAAYRHHMEKASDVADNGNCQKWIAERNKLRENLLRAARGDNP